MLPLRTIDVQDRTGISTFTLNQYIRSRKMPAPARDRNGNYLWTEADIQNAIAASKIDRRRRNAAAEATHVN